MPLHTDIPTRSEVDQLLGATAPWCVSIYVPTSPVTPEAETSRIEFKNAAASALEQLAESAAGNDEIEELRESLDDLHDDTMFWTYQAHSLAVFATGGGVRTYRLPNRLLGSVSVGERFHLTPLLRTVTFPQAAFVLALAQGSVRLLEVSPDLPVHEVRVADLPESVADAAGKTSITDRSPMGSIQSSEGQKVRMRQYARKIDAAVRPVLIGHELPLILAATQPLDAIYRSVNSYPHLAPQGLAGNPETVSDADLAAEARRVLDALYAAELTRLRERFDTFASRGRTATDLTDVARAATYGAVDTVLLDIDAEVAGTVDEQTGAVSLDDDAGSAYGRDRRDRPAGGAGRRSRRRRPGRLGTGRRPRGSDSPLPGLNPLTAAPAAGAVPGPAAPPRDVAAGLSFGA